MKKRRGIILLGALILSSFIMGGTTYADSNTVVKEVGRSNPLIDHHLGADPAALSFNGRVYLYLSSDQYEYNQNGSIKDNSFANLNQVYIISSSDMVNWTDHGAVPVAGANGLNGGRGIAKWAWGSWAPAAAVKKINGKDKFFLYFANSGAGIGVLTADSPTGPWKDPLGKALVSGSTPGMSGVVWMFDPAVLVDDDGSGYLYCGGGIPGDKNPSQWQIANPKTARVLKLGNDMTSVQGAAKTIDAPYMFEDSGIHKYKGVYYYSYCINFNGNHPWDTPKGEIGYMTSNNPMGPFSYKGHFLKNPGNFFPSGGNNHHSVFQLNNQWYVAYHTQVVSQVKYGSGKGYRSPHINKLAYNGDGSIQEVKADYNGISQLANLNPYERVEAETIAWNRGILTENTSASGGPVSNQQVTNIHNGDFIAVGNADFGSEGAKSFKANVASSVGGKIEIHLDKENGRLVGAVDVPNTGGDRNFREVQTTISNATGVHNVFFVFRGNGNQQLFQFESWQFSKDEGGGSYQGTTYEAERDTTLVNSAVESLYTGYTGEGYVNFNAYSGASIQWNKVLCTISGTKNITFRYALESGTRNLDLYVNGNKIKSVEFPATGSWTNWREITVQVPLTEGDNVLRIETTGEEGPNIDNMNAAPNFDL